MKNFMKNKILVVSLIATLALLAVPALASAAEPTAANRVRTFYGIGHVNADPAPVVAYVVHGKELIRAGTLYVPNQIGKEGPRGIVVDSKHERIYLSHENSHFLDTIDARTFQILEPTRVEARNPAGMAIDNENDRLFVTDGPGSTIYVYDTDTMTLVDQWDLQITEGYGAFGLAYLDGYLYVGQLSDHILAYEVGTHHEKSKLSINDYGVAIAAVSDPSPVLFSTKGRNGSKLTRYNVANGMETQADTGLDLRGLRVNPFDEVVYVLAHKPDLMDPQAGVWIFDSENLEELGHEIFGAGPSWSATDCSLGAVDFGSTVMLDLASPVGGKVNAGGQLHFTATFKNAGNQDLHVLPARLLYDSDLLRFVSATPAPSSSISGELSWTDLVSLDGSDLPWGESLTVEITFEAKNLPKDCSSDAYGYNIAQTRNTMFADGSGAEDAAGSSGFTVFCPSIDNNDPAGDAVEASAPAPVPADTEDDGDKGCGC